MAIEPSTADEPTSASPQTAVRPAAPTPSLGPDYNPWPALWAMVLGFFMILVDSTIVAVATPAIMVALGADVNGVVWAAGTNATATPLP